LDLNDYFGAKLPDAIIFCGPTNCGKTTIAKKAQEMVARIVLAITATSRPKRKGEVHGRDYFFYSKNEMGRIIAHKQLFEFTKRGSHKYGIPMKEIAKIGDGSCRIFVVDSKGVEKFALHYPEIPVILFDVERDQLRRRLLARDPKGSDRNERLEKIDEELAWYRDNAERLGIIRVANPDGRDIDEVVTEALEKACQRR